MRLAVVCRAKGARELTQAPSMTPSGLIGARPLTRWAFDGASAMATPGRAGVSASCPLMCAIRTRSRLEPFSS